MSLRVGASPSPVGIDGSSRRSGASVSTSGKPTFATILRDAVSAADRSRTPSLPVRADAADTVRHLALQAEVYRESERVEIVSRLVDHAVSAVKTLLQSRF